MQEILYNQVDRFKAFLYTRVKHRIYDRCLLNNLVI